MFSLVAVAAELAEQLVAIETGGEDAVHQARTRVRRLRSILGVYRGAFDPEADRRLRARLKALGDRLGEVRDLEVRALALEELAAAAGTEAEADLARLSTAVRAEHAGALARLLERLGGRAHRRLVADLQLYAAEPPLTPAGRKHPGRVVRKGLRRALDRAREVRGDSLEERHATRKAARRLRYAAEAVADDLGRDAVRLAAAAEAVQDALGAHRDGVLLAGLLREHGLAEAAERCEREAGAALDGLDAKLDALEL